MTEKRFTRHISFILDNEKKGMERLLTIAPAIDLLNELHEENEQLKQEDELFFGKVFDILLKYQDLFNREMADEVLEELGIELTKWFE